MPCGLAGLKSVVPYFYCIYFATLLIHRERRDDLACRAKCAPGRGGVGSFTPGRYRQGKQGAVLGA
jgi:hypothetical protein